MIDWLIDWQRTISLINLMNKSGPNIDTWGTCELLYFILDDILFNATKWDRPSKYHFKSLQALTPKPKILWSISIRILWTTLSNAFERSISTRIVKSPLSKKARISSKTFNTALLQPFQLWYLDWCDDNYLFSESWLSIWL